MFGIVAAAKARTSSRAAWGPGFVGILVCLLPLATTAQERSGTGNGSFFHVVWGSGSQDGSGRGSFGQRPNTPQTKTKDGEADIGDGPGFVIPMSMAVDARFGTGTVSNTNGVLEPGEFVVVDPSWLNYSIYTELDTGGTLSNFTGPAGGTYAIHDAAANYTLPQMTPRDCNDGSSDACYTVSVTGTRSAMHWDANVDETTLVPVPSGLKTWTLHIGESFPDVPTNSIFYSDVETLLHNGVTGGCFGGGYCPSNPVTRAQAAVFLLKSKFGAAYVPPHCTGSVFADVHCAGSPFDSWIEDLAARGITTGCGGGHYCPGDTLTRQQMAVLLLKTLEGFWYTPPACTPQFDDVPCPGQFADWISDLHGRGITTGCSAAPALYCPTASSTRAQMAAFLTRTFGLALYGG